MIYLKKNNIDEAILQKLRKKDVYKSDMYKIYNIIVGQTNAITKWQIAYVLLDPVADYVHILDFNTRLRVVSSILFPLTRLGRKSEPCKEEILFFLYWYTLPRARNLKPLFEFQTP